MHRIKSPGLYLKKHALHLNKGIAIIAVFFIFSISFLSCHHNIPVKRGFYYWRSSFSLSRTERSLVDSLKIQKLYIKYFELAKGTRNELEPVAIISWLDSLPVKVEIVPVVFIPNNTLLNMPGDSVPGYAKKIYRQISAIHPSYAVPFCEIQIDCDWTDKTQHTFFALIENLKKICKESKVLLSVTLRLHQAKYRTKTGVPNADRATLMFYNMGKLDTSSSHISILDLQQGNKYIQSLKSYPLPLDVALPVFGWGLQMRGGRAVDVIHNFDSANADSLPYLKKLSKGIYMSDSSLFYHGLYITQGDLVKTELPKYEDLLTAEKKLVETLPCQQRTLILFDLEPDLTSHYDAQKIQNIYTRLN